MQTRKTGLLVATCVVGVLTLGAAALGVVFKVQANWSDDYLHDQLAEHAITFTAVDQLFLPEQKTIPCLVENAGKPLLTGKQAECYARYQIGLGLTAVDQGKTYFESHYNGYLSRVAAAKAVADNAPNAAELQAAAVKADRISDDLLAGEATRGLLLTGYGFSVMSNRLSTAALVLFILAGIGLIGTIVLGVFWWRGRNPAT